MNDLARVVTAEAIFEDIGRNRKSLSWQENLGYDCIGTNWMVGGTQLTVSHSTFHFGA